MFGIGSFGGTTIVSVLRRWRIQRTTEYVVPIAESTMNPIIAQKAAGDSANEPNAREDLTPEDDREHRNYRKTRESRDESDRKQLVAGVLKCAGSDDYSPERKRRRRKAAQHDSVGGAFIHLFLPIIKPFPAHHLFETGFSALPGKEV